MMIKLIYKNLLKKFLINKNKIEKKFQKLLFLEKK